MEAKGSTSYNKRRRRRNEPTSFGVGRGRKGDIPYNPINQPQSQTPL
jgi:hypothetical protein